MPVLYHAPKSRSSALLALLHELGDPPDLELRHVDIPRMDGSGARDPANPHPEGKVPYLVDGDEQVRERGAIILWLTERYPSAIAPPPGAPGRGAFLSWLFWYHAVFEPLLMLSWAGLSHPVVEASFRDMPTAIRRIEEALEGRPYLLGEGWSAADLLIASAFAFVPDLIPETGPIRDWVARCQARPSVARLKDDPQS